MKHFYSLFCCVALAALGCEPEIGSPCDPSAEFVNSEVLQRPGSNDLVLDPRFDTCKQALCLSTDGSRPYCTRICVSDQECQLQDAAFTCQQVVAFGPLACTDFTPENNCLKEDGTPSDNPIFYCAASNEVIAERDKTFGRASN
jgi:hypothetical protein